MKRYTLLLLVGSLMVGLAAEAQIAIPQKQRIDSKEYNIHLPLVPIKKLPVKEGLFSQPMEQDPGSHITSGTYFRSPNFDPAWAGRFQAVLDSLIDVSNVPGASLAVISPEEGVFYGVSGVSYDTVAIVPEMRFGIGSNTKLFIGVTLLKLQEQGLLSLDDSLHQWLPSFQYVDSSITIRQMLRHQSGLFDHLNDNISLFTDSVWADTSRFWTDEEILATIGGPHFESGRGWVYSNTNYLLAAKVIEAVTGEPWVDILHQEVLDPLTLDSTFVGAFEPRNGPVAAEWDIFTGEVITNVPMTAAYSLLHAAGNILSAAQEMALWYKSLLESDYLSASSLQQLLEFEPIFYYGLGIWANQYNSKLAYSHTGGTLGFMSMMWYDLETKSILCILYNGRDAVPEQFLALLNVLYDDFPKKENDAAITEIMHPWANVCSNPVNPLVVIRNHGSNVLSSVQVNYHVDDEAAVSTGWAGSLQPGDTAHVFLDEMNLEDGPHLFTCYTTLPNGMADPYAFNDTAKSNFIVNTQAALSLPYFEEFEGEIFPPEGWSLGSNSIFGWRDNDVVAYNGAGTAMKNNYQDASIGSFYDMDLPLLSIGEWENAALQFHYAYTKQPGNNFDSLQVLISSDCGETWDKLFHKGGLSLMTAIQTYNPFYPVSAGQWKEEVIPLEDYINRDVIIRFRAICGASNNLYLDDVVVNYSIGYEEGPELSTFDIFPNPSTDRVSVSGLPLGSEISLLDITGKLLYHSTIDEEAMIIDLGGFPKGMYILRTRVGSKKLVVW